MPEIVGEYVDRLVSVEMRVKGLPRGKTHLLYDAARIAQGEPLSLAAARGLQTRVTPGSFIFVATGAGAPPWLPLGESDGPPGAAAIARAVDLALGAKTVYLCRETHVDPLIAASQAAGVYCCDGEMARQRNHAAVVETVPTNDGDARAKAQRLIDLYQPTAMVAVEKLGPNAKGVTHSVMGKVHQEPDAKISHAFDLARERGIFTVGIGDGGNEIGFGKVYEATRAIQDYGARCQCPCGDGMATVTTCDALVVAATSNWGAYGVAALLALLTGVRDALHTPEIERRLLEDCARAGGMDGVYADPSFRVDGITGETSMALVRLLNEIVANAMITHHRAF